MLLWLEMDGVLCKRGGNDLLWCWSGECKAVDDDGDDVVSVAVVLAAVDDDVVLPLFVTDAVAAVVFVVSAIVLVPWCKWCEQSY